jgi:hypothetical protein
VHPEVILRMATDREVRLVQDGNELLEVLLESLDRLNEKLQGETPSVQFLWYPSGHKQKKPIDENSLSDFVKIHFDDDLKKRGIIANREVEIRSGPRTGSGERTDLHIDATTQSPDNMALDVLTVIVETKGCWHSQLDQAMETQLADRYLRDNACRFGIYLVGWFNCPHWDRHDPRSRTAPSLTLEEAREQFQLQAVDLSTRQDVTIRSYVLNTSLRHWEQASLIEAGRHLPPHWLNL